MTGLPHIYPRADRIGELVRAQQWDAVTYAIEGWRATHGAERAYFRRLALHEICTWKARAYERPTDTVIRALWDCAKERQIEVCGMSWGGFNLVGDKKSVDELRRLMNEEVRFRAYRQMVEAGYKP